MLSRQVIPVRNMSTCHLTHISKPIMSRNMQSCLFSGFWNTDIEERLWGKQTMRVRPFSNFQFAALLPLSSTPTLLFLSPSFLNPSPSLPVHPISHCVTFHLSFQIVIILHLWRTHEKKASQRSSRAVSYWNSLSRKRSAVYHYQK